MTRLQILSDLHTEFFTNQYELIHFLKSLTDKQSKDTVLVVAGDFGAPFSDIVNQGGWTTGLCKNKELYHIALNVLTQKYRKVLLVPGNHEYYGSSLFLVNEWLREQHAAYSNLIVLNNATHREHDILFIGSTLWFPNRPDNILYWRGMTDCTLNKTSLEEIEIEGEFAAQYIGDRVAFAKKHNLRPIVITHMGPSYLSVPEQFKTSKLNGFYVNENVFLEIDKQQKDEPLVLFPDFWFQGHTHTSLDYEHPSGTRVICNPFGYRGYNENRNFNPHLTLEV